MKIFLIIITIILVVISSIFVYNKYFISIKEQIINNTNIENIIKEIPEIISTKINPLNDINPFKNINTNPFE